MREPEDVNPFLTQQDGEPTAINDETEDEKQITEREHYEDHVPQEQW